MKGLSAHGLLSASNFSIITTFEQQCLRFYPHVEKSGLRGIDLGVAKGENLKNSNLSSRSYRFFQLQDLPFFVIL
jgi:hypothetical protein